MTSEEAPRTVHLLWSGGWSSTFRALTALHLEGAQVRPHYVLDPLSRHAEMEIDAMRRVRDAVREASPEQADRLLPMASVGLDELQEDDAEAERFARLNARAELGRHYEWLGRYARHAGLDGLEVGSHRHDALTALLDGNLRPVRERPFTTYRLSDEALDTDLGLFAGLSFPLAELTRADMRRIALEGGFLETLELTWFCLTPRRGETCGVCVKCHAAVEDGLGHLLSPAGHRRHDLKWHSSWRPWQRVVDRVVG